MKIIFLVFIAFYLVRCSPEEIIAPTDDTTAIANAPEITIGEAATNPETENPTEEEQTEDIIKDEPTEEIIEDEVIEEEPTEEPTEETEEEIIDEAVTDAENLLILVNQSRTAEGLPALTLNNALNIAAEAHSLDMNTNNYFDHEGLNGSRFWERTADAGYTGIARGENIAKGQSSVEAVHDSWMTSEDHRDNILAEDITEMGLGHSGIYWTQIFGRAR